MAAFVNFSPGRMKSAKVGYEEMSDIAAKIYRTDKGSRITTVLSYAVRLTFLLLLRRKQVFELTRGIASGPDYSQTAPLLRTVHTAEMICYLSGVEEWPLREDYSRGCLDITKDNKLSCWCRSIEHIAPWQEYYEKLVALYGNNADEPLFPNENGKKYYASRFGERLAKYTGYTLRDFRTFGLFFYYDRLIRQGFRPRNAISALAKLTNLTESYLIGRFTGHYGA